MPSLAAEQPPPAELGGEDGLGRRADTSIPPPLLGRYCLDLPRMLDVDVARLHGFDTPSDVLSFAQMIKRVDASARLDELPPEED